MEVGVRVEAEDMRSGERHHCCSAYLTFVSLEARRGAGPARIDSAAAGVQLKRVGAWQGTWQGRCVA
jgi:acyl-CoA hydrolase